MAPHVCYPLGRGMTFCLHPAKHQFSRNADFKELRCMNFTSKGTREILVAGCQDKMFKVDVEKGTIVETVRFLWHRERAMLTLAARCRCAVHHHEACGKLHMCCNE
jgi:hypothetical protein